MGSSCSTGKVLSTAAVAPPHSGGALRTLRAVTWGTMTEGLSHLDESGRVQMVDVGGKPMQQRRRRRRRQCAWRAGDGRAVGYASCPCSDALACAEVAGIMAAKRTSDLIPLCHPLPLTHVSVRAAGRRVRRDHGRRRDHRADGRRDGGADGGLCGGAGAVRHGQGRGRGAGRRGHPPRGEDEVMKAAVLTVSDGISNGTRDDLSGDVLAELLEAEGLRDPVRRSRRGQRDFGSDLRARRVGTGRAHDGRHRRRAARRDARGDPGSTRPLGPRHRGGNPPTPSRRRRTECCRAESRIRGKTLIVNLPGSPGGCRDGFAVFRPALGHAVKLLAA